VTRVAGGDPALWEQIVTGNASAVAGLLTQVRDQLDVLIDAVSQASASRWRRSSSGVWPAPWRSRASTADRRGRPARCSSPCPTIPASWARLFADAGESQVNIEDVRIDHDPARDDGPGRARRGRARAEHLMQSLEARGWAIHR